MRLCHPQFETFFDRRHGISFNPELVDGRVVAVADVPNHLVRWFVRRGFKLLDVPPPVALQDALAGESNLPRGFPGRDALAKAGYFTRSSLTGMTADALVGLRGIGPATAKAILDELG